MVNNLDFLRHNLWCSVGVVDGVPRAGSHYNLGTSRGPDKIGSRADPARGPRLTRGWSTHTILSVTLLYFMCNPPYLDTCLGSFGVNRTITYSEPVNFIDSGTNYTGRRACHAKAIATHVSDIWKDRNTYGLASARAPGLHTQ